MLRAVPLAALLAGADAAPAALAGTALQVPAQGIVLGPGSYGVDHDLSVSSSVLLQPGARIVVAKGCTLTLTGDFQAPAEHVFIGAGRIDLNASRVLVARAEWWGAVADDRLVDCLPALEAAIAAHGWIVLAPGDYHVSDTLRILMPNRCLEGTSGYAAGRATISRLLLTRATSDVVQVGPDRDPGGAGKFLSGIVLRRLELVRSVEPASTGTMEGGGPAGLRVQFAIACRFEDLTSSEHATGYVLRAAVRSFMRNCSAFRSRSGAGGDTFVGFLFDGAADIGLAGGNASLYVDECVASTGGNPRLSRSIGAYLPGAFSDIYLTRFEMATMTDGIVVEGLAADRDARRTRTGNVNLHINAPILDAVSHAGLTLSRLASYAVVDIIDPYIAPVPGSLASIYVHDSGGMTTITGGQLIGWYDTQQGGNAIGVHAVNAGGVTVRGLKILGFRRPFGLTGCRDFDIDVAISNPREGASQAAVQMAACDRGSVRARVTGQRDAFPQGVRLDGQANQHVTIDATGIDPAAIKGGDVNKLVWDRVPIRAAGPFGTHLATGILS